MISEDYEDEWGEDVEFSGDDFNENYDDADDIDMKQEYVVLDYNELYSEMNSIINDVSGLIQMSNDICAILLRSFRWNKEDLCSKYFDNNKKLLIENGLENYNSYDSISKGFVDISKPIINCLVCLEEIKSNEAWSLPCQHACCYNCYENYLIDKIKQGKIAVLTTCPMYKCPLKITDSCFDKLVHDKNMINRYKESLIKSFVEDNNRMRWCTAPNCDHAIKGFGGLKSVKCRCGHEFCFTCHADSHAPATCEQLQMWLEKCKNESETAHWIIANTKTCPKCRIRIEKNHGCNHMTCQQCRYEFCWVCMGSWKDHGNQTGGFYKCNKYKPKFKKTKDSDEETAAKAELDRYIHFYQRYNNHDLSIKIAQKYLAAAEERMIEMQGKDENQQFAWIDVQFLKQAVKQVFACRRVLMYTYVFGYYLDDGPEKELFEFLQQELEKNTETLSELVEQPIEALDQSELINYSRVTEKFMKNLLDGVERGLTE